MGEPGWLYWGKWTQPCCQLDSRLSVPVCFPVALWSRTEVRRSNNHIFQVQKGLSLLRAKVLIHAAISCGHLTSTPPHLHNSKCRCVARWRGRSPLETCISFLEVKGHELQGKKKQIWVWEGDVVSRCETTHLRWDWNPQFPTVKHNSDVIMGDRFSNLQIGWNQGGRISWWLSTSGTRTEF